MNIKIFRFTAELWVWKGDGAWHFVTLPKQESNEIKELTNGLTNSFGSVKVEVTIGNTIWHTSIFPDNASNSYLLPIKKSVRLSEHLEVGQQIEVSLDLAELSK